MSTSTLRKQDYTQDDLAVPEESWEVKRLSIAIAAEAACMLGNSVDMEAFAAHYGFDRTSCFA